MMFKKKKKEKKEKKKKTSLKERAINAISDYKKDQTKKYTTIKDYFASDQIQSEDSKKIQEDNMNILLNKLIIIAILVFFLVLLIKIF